MNTMTFYWNKEVTSTCPTKILRNRTKLVIHVNENNDLLRLELLALTVFSKLGAMRGGQRNIPTHETKCTANSLFVTTRDREKLSRLHISRPTTIIKIPAGRLIHCYQIFNRSTTRQSDRVLCCVKRLLNVT